VAAGAQPAGTGRRREYIGPNYGPPPPRRIAPYPARDRAGWGDGPKQAGL